MSIFSIVPEMKILSEIDRIIMKGHEAGPGDVGKLIRWLDHPNPEVRKAVAEAAAGEFLAGDYGLTAAVMRHVQTDASPEVREACIGHLGFAGVNHQHHADFEAEGERRPPDYDLDCPPQYQEVRELLAKIATNDKETENLRKAAIEELGHLGEDAAARRPVEAFLHHSAPGLRAAAVTAAGFWSSAYGLESGILALLDDPDAEVQREALITCGSLRIRAAVDRLRTLCTSPNPSLRGAALIGFAACGPIDEATAILNALSESVKEDDPLYDDIQDARHELTCRYPGDDEEPAEDTLGDAEAEPDDEENDDEIDKHVQALLDHEGRDKLTRKEAEDLAFVARHFLEFIHHEAGMPLDPLDKQTVEEYLLERFPEKVTVPMDETSSAPAYVARLLRYLGACGLLRNADKLADYALSLRARFEEAMKDPANWGMTKTLLMAAHATGVDIRDRKQLEAFMAGYSARLLGPHLFSHRAADRPKPVEPPALPKEQESGPPTPPSPKVGRNAPCPCGSGKKFKKCCGR